MDDSAMNVAAEETPRRITHDVKVTKSTELHKLLRPLYYGLAAAFVLAVWMGFDLYRSGMLGNGNSDGSGLSYHLPVNATHLTCSIQPLIPSEAVQTQLPSIGSEREEFAVALCSDEGFAALATSLTTETGLAFESRPAITIPDHLFDADRQQYRIDEVLDWMVADADPRSFRTICVLPVDVYAPGFNFLFGLAKLGGSTCVASTARMGGCMDFPKLSVTDRWHSIALHELGHTLGLEHSNEKGSVMVYGNSLEELDAQGTSFTRKDWRRIKSLNPVSWHSIERPGKTLDTEVNAG